MFRLFLTLVWNDLLLVYITYFTISILLFYDRNQWFFYLYLSLEVIKNYIVIIILEDL